MDPDARTISAGSHQTRVDLKAMEVLLRLAEAPGSVVWKEEIFEAVWPQQAVADEVLPVAIHHLRKALGDEASSPRYIETIPKSGYRLLVSPASVRAAGWRRPSVLAGAGVVVAVAVALGLVLGQTPTPIAPAAVPAQERTVAVAVPAFVDLSPSGSLGAHAEGLSRTLASSLARQPALRVTVGRTVDEHHGFTVSGTVERSSGVGVRATVQVHSREGRVLWAVTLDGPVDDPTSLQDRLVAAFRKGGVPAMLERLPPTRS